MTLTHESSVSPWAALLFAAGAAALSGYTYYRLRGLLASHHWSLLVTLRLTALMALLLLLVRPVATVYTAPDSAPQLLLLLDRSASMQVSDVAGNEDRWHAVLARLPGWLAAVRSSFATRLVVFDAQTRPVRDLAELRSVEPDGQATSLAAAIRAVAEGRPQLAVLVSDGIHNTAGDPRRLAAELGVPIYTVGVGSSLEDRAGLRDIQVVDIVLPAELPLRNRVQAKAMVEAVGCEGTVVEVRLTEDETVVATATLELDALKGTHEVLLEFVPEREGLHTYTVSIPPAPFESIPQNNTKTAMARVSARRIRVFYVEGTLRAEYGALVQHFLARDPDIAFLAMVQIRPNLFMKRTTIPELQAVSTLPEGADFWRNFDVVILGDLDVTYWRGEALRGLVRWLRDGGGLLALGGYHALGPGGYADSPLAAVLPVALLDRNAGQVEEPFVPQLTPAGAAHPIFAGITDYFPTEAEPARVSLPPLLGATRVGPARPAATVLLVCPAAKAAGGDRPMPLLAVQPVGKGRSAVFAADTTRVWYQAMKTIGRDSPFVRFWGQLLRWLANRDVSGLGLSLTARTTKAWYRQGEQVVVEAEVRDQEGAGTDEADLTVTLSGPTGSLKAKLTPVGDLPGRYQKSFTGLEPGRYRVVVAGTLGGETLESAELEFEVGRKNLEFDQLALNEPLLIEIATASGGQYVHLTLADRLFRELQAREQGGRIARQIQLAWPPLIWALFAAVLCTEWYLRRRWRLR